MSSHRRVRDKQVRLTVFDNEPIARLAEQRLLQEGVGCFIRSLQGGPGLWGSAFNLPHALYVYESQEMQAREILDLTPKEITERDSGSRVSMPSSQKVMLTIIIITVLLILIIVGPSFTQLFG